MNRVNHHLCIRMVCLAINCAMLLACVGVLAARTPANDALKVVHLNREFKLNAGQQVTLKGTRLRIQFVNVENDSRCPSDVTCVWAGNAAVRLQLSAGKNNKTLTLNTSSNSGFVREVEYQGYKVALVDLSPYPRSDRKVAPHDYVVTLRVSKV